MNKHFVPGSRQANNPWGYESPRSIETIRADVLQNLKNKRNDLELRKMNLETELETIIDAISEIDSHIEFATKRYELSADKAKKSEEEIEF